jgi:outer membrane cobalamin receptor
LTPPLLVGGYQIRVDALSYSSLNHIEIFPAAAVMDLRVEVVRVAYELEPLVVTARRPNRLERTGYYRREEAGVGHFVDLAEIQARQPLEVSDLFRSVPGARIIPGRFGSGGDVRLRGGCSPQLVVDGVALVTPARIDGLFRPGDLEAIEVYHGPTAPIEYNGRSTCGTIMVWTRNPPEPAGYNMSIAFKKLAFIVGIATLAVVSTR